MTTVRVSIYDRPLFAGDSLSELLNKQLDEAKREVVKLRAEEVLSIDPGEWVEETMARLGPGRLELRLADAHLEPRGADSPPVLAVPFDGAQDWIDRDPERPADQRVFSRGGRPKGHAAGGVLKCELSGPPRPDFNAKAMIDSCIEELAPWVEHVNALLAAQEQRMREALTQAITERQGKERDAQTFYSTSPLPIRRRDDAPKTFSKPAIVRKPTPTAKRGSRSRSTEPVMSREYYEHILDVVRAAGRAMTRSPGTYAGWGEEDRRQALLLMLNTHYEGQGHAEAFNGTGKTDILIRVEDHNIFIAECLVWAGPKHFSAKLDQLLGYATWHDTKLALVVFVDRRDHAAVVEAGLAALAEHSEFAEWLDAEEDDEMRCSVRLAGDEGRKAELHVFFISTPPAATVEAEPGETD